jgi:hypothetical protein
VKGSNEVFGGYNPIVWKSVYDYDITNNSFIFSFKNKNINNHIVSRVKEKKYAINYWDLYGPSFGRGDLMIYSGFEIGINCDFYRSYANSCKKTSYEKSIRKTESAFSVEELEVFQIIKKL